METNTTQAPTFPKPTGDYAVGTTSLYFADPEREETFTEDPNDKREITAKVWYPSEKVPGATTAPYMSEELSRALASGFGVPPQDFTKFIQSISTHSVENAPVGTAESKYPVVFLSHGGGDMPEFNTVRAEELASQGYIVVAINHTYESAVNILSDGRVAPHSPLPDAADNVAARAEDIQFVLDELEKFNAGSDPTGLFNGKLDLNRLGVFGVSTGGATAAEILSIDPRFKAGANLDGTLRGDTPNASLSQPYLQFNNVAFGTEISSDEISRELDDRTLYNNFQNEGYEVTTKGTTHLHYTSDVPFLFPLLRDSGMELGALTEFLNYFFNPQAAIETYEHENFELIDPNRVTQITNDYLTAFFDRYLKNRESPLFADSSFPLPEAYPEVIAQSYKGENLLSDKDGDDEICGGRENDSLYGGGGNDVLKGGDGSDALHGGGGDNSLYGESGNDYLFGHDGNDSLHGGEAHDFLHGDGGDDVLEGDNGDDSLIGASGDDTMSGGKGNDTLSGGAGNDRLKDTQGNNILYGDAGDDELRAGHGDDKLDGDSGNDILIAGAGDDRLNGGTGDDVLQGGSGLNKFYLSSGQDTIQDFQDGRDLLGLPVAIDNTPLSFSALDLVQVGQNTEIRWKLEGMGDLGNQIHTTTLEGIQASQITANDFVQITP
ncbi:alpha/beta hydrolase [Chroococcidiopsis sp.]|uniref:alpha/beta hydrolase n=1 Tax=Chroococcidiopsis sp. TaxID=3088168 RepID=UPI003F3406B5